MASQPTSPLPVGQVLEISFATFTPRITIHSERDLTVEIIAGDNIGFSDTIEYEAVAVRDGLVILTSGISNQPSASAISKVYNRGLTAECAILKLGLR